VSGEAMTRERLYELREISRDRVLSQDEVEELLAEAAQVQSLTEEFETACEATGTMQHVNSRECSSQIVNTIKKLRTEVDSLERKNELLCKTVEKQRADLATAQRERDEAEENFKAACKWVSRIEAELAKHCPKNALAAPSCPDEEVGCSHGTVDDAIVVDQARRADSAQELLRVVAGQVTPLELIGSTPEGKLDWLERHARAALTPEPSQEGQEKRKTCMHEGWCTCPAEKPFNLGLAARLAEELKGQEKRCHKPVESGHLCGERVPCRLHGPERWCKCRHSEREHDGAQTRCRGILPSSLSSFVECPCTTFVADPEKEGA
jgi:hypothetical protein